MKLGSIEQMHKDHVEWSSFIHHWKIEIRFLKNLLMKIHANKFETEFDDLVKELINKLNHFNRYLKEISEIIDTHEAFLKDFMGESKTRVNRQELLDHYKTRDRMLDFYRNFKNIKEKVYKVTEKYY